MRKGRFPFSVFPVLLALLAASVAFAPVRAEPVGGGAPRGQRWAVLVGVNEYTELQDLNYCVADARRLRDELVASGFHPDNVVLLVDDPERQADQPFRAMIQRRIETVLALAEKDDLVLVSFSGHGVHLDGKGYFCPTEASLANPEETMVSLELIYGQLEASAARRKLLLVDVGRNDPRPPGRRDAVSHQKSLTGLGEQLKTVPDSILVLSSSAPGQTSWEDEKLGHGVFMYHLSEGLSGRADANRDGEVSVLELYQYASVQTRRWVLKNRPGSAQTPELLGKFTGDWDIGRARVDPESPPRPTTKPEPRPTARRILASEDEIELEVTIVAEVVGDWAIAQTLPAGGFFVSAQAFADWWKKTGGDAQAMPQIDFGNSIVCVKARDAADPNRVGYSAVVDAQAGAMVMALATLMGFEPSDKIRLTVIEIPRAGLVSIKRWMLVEDQNGEREFRTIRYPLEPEPQEGHGGSKNSR